MKASDKKLARDIVREIVTSNMSTEKKLVLLRLIDKAFRRYLGNIYWSNEDLEDADVLFRSL